MDGLPQKTHDPVTFEITVPVRGKWLAESHRAKRLPAVTWPLDIILLALVVWVIYASRLAELPLCGEEPRRAEVAREMVLSGDFIVPRQQGQVYCSRPPLQNWVIAAFAWFRKSWDVWTIRLPSVLATFLLVLGIYWYVRHSLGRVAAVAAAGFYATSGQVMEIGGLGETDALFALLLGGALLSWDAFINGGKSPAWGILSGILAGLSGLTKGAQGPVWFSAVVLIWSILQWWKGSLTRRYSAAMVSAGLSLGAVTAAWTVAYLLATSPEHAWQIWFGQIQSRLQHHHFWAHLALRPIETLGCWLPWTPLLAVYVSPRYWNQLDPKHRSLAIRWALALLVTFPMVWLVPDARNRYFLPLYPAAAIFCGLTILYVARGENASLAKLWTYFVNTVGFAAGSFAGFAILAIPFAHWFPFPLGWDVRTVAFLVALTAGFWLLREYLENRKNCAEANRSPYLREQELALTLLAIMLLVGWSFTNFVYATRVAAAHDPSPQIAMIKQSLPQPEKLVSFGPVFHRFRYYYGLPIRLLPLPQTADKISPDVTYFCVEGILVGPRRKLNSGSNSVVRSGAFSYHLGNVDTTRQEQVAEGSDLVFILETSGGSVLYGPPLPFNWELVAVVPCGRNRKEKVQPAILVGKILRCGTIAHREKNQGLDTAEKIR